MATATPPRKTEPTPLFALVGATELALEGVRQALADATRRQAEMQVQVRTKLEQLPAELEQVPGYVLGRTLEAAARTETRYEELAERGKTLVERVRSQKTTQDLLDQGRNTISRTKAAVTTARHAAEEVASSALDTFTVGRSQAAAVIDDTATSVTEHARPTAQAARATTATARKRTARTRTAARTAATGVRRTAAATRTTAADTANTAERATKERPAKRPARNTAKSTAPAPATSPEKTGD